jgi:hypothetical protein
MLGPSARFFKAIERLSDKKIHYLHIGPRTSSSVGNSVLNGAGGTSYGAPAGAGSATGDTSNAIQSATGARSDGIENLKLALIQG